MKLSASLNAENSEIVCPFEQAKNITEETNMVMLRPKVQKNSFMHLIVSIKKAACAQWELQWRGSLFRRCADDPLTKDIGKTDGIAIFW